MKPAEIDALVSFDQQHLWHPYASMQDPPPAYPVGSAQGARLRLADGRELIDGMSSWWAAIHGYNHPRLNQAAKDQIDKMAHVMFGGITHEPAVELGKRLVRMTPEPLNKVFLADSGSVSVEVAIKMALQYWHSRGQPNKQKLVALRNGYHGDTFGAMSVCDPVTGMHHLFGDALPAQLFAPAPTCPPGSTCSEEDIAEMRHILEKHSNEIAAVIVEPHIALWRSSRQCHRNCLFTTI